MYVKIDGDIRIIIPLWVDDITLASNSKPAVLDLVQELSKHFKVHDLGETNCLLGMEITRDRPNHCLYISQRQYILNILDRFNFADCKPVTTPMEPGLQLTTAMCPQTDVEQEEIRAFLISMQLVH
jgi:hypothetical protein